MSKFNQDFIQYSDKKVKDETKHLTLYFIVHITLYIVLLFFLIFFAWYTVFIATHKFYAVSGVSMMSTLNSKITDDQLHHDISTAQKLSFDAVYVDKMTKPKLYDIIVVERSSKDSVIKRLMAVEGDFITIAKGTDSDGKERFYFYRIPKGTENLSDEEARLTETGENGYQLYDADNMWAHNVQGSISTDYTVNGFTNTYEYNFFDTFLRDYKSENPKYTYKVSSSGLLYVQVPPNQIFYMGDNRAFSTDCRERGFCDAKYIVGRAEFIVYDYNFGNRLLEVIKFYFSEMEEFFAR